MTADTAMWNRDGMESLTTLGPNLASAVITAGGSRNGRGFAMMMYVSYFFLLAFLSPIIFCCRWVPTAGDGCWAFKPYPRLYISCC